MIIYLEVAILDNLIINSLLIYLTSQFFKMQINKLRLIAGSLVGTIFALIFPLLKVNNVFLILLKIMLAVVICGIAFNPKTSKRFMQQTLCFIFLTFLLGGFIIAIFELLNISIDNIVLCTYSSMIPISIFIIAVLVFVLTLKKLMKMVFATIKTNKFMFKVKIKLGNNVAISQGFFDTGNTLKDDKCGLPVCIITQKLFQKIYPEFNFMQLFLRKQINIKDGHYIFYSTVSSNDNVMFVFRPDILQINNGNEWVSSDVLLGVSLKNFTHTEKFEVLLNGFCEVRNGNI